MQEDETIDVIEEDHLKGHYLNVDQDECFVERLRRLISLGVERVKEGVSTAPCTEFPLYVDPGNSLAVARVRGEL